MADLTSTITISGIVNGRKINVSSTMTMQDVYDAGIAQPGDNETSYSTVGMSADRALTFEQDCPSYLFMINRSPTETGIASLRDPGGSVDFAIVLPPNGFVVLNEYQNGAGILALSTTTTNIALQGVTAATVDRIPDIGFVVKSDIMVAFEAAS